MPAGTPSLTRLIRSIASDGYDLATGARRVSTSFQRLRRTSRGVLSRPLFNSGTARALPALARLSHHFSSNGRIWPAGGRRYWLVTREAAAISLAPSSDNR